jgi:hypothetical protein
LPGPFLLLYSLGVDMALMLAKMDLGQAEQHCTLFILSAGCTPLCIWPMTCCAPTLLGTVIRLFIPASVH